MFIIDFRNSRKSFINPMLGSILLFIVVLQIISCKAASLTAPDESIIYVSVNPTSIPINGTANVQVIGYKASGSFIADGTIISFSCDLGTIEAQAETQQGVANVRYTAPDSRSGIAHIDVRSGHAEISPESISITVGGAALNALTISADPQSLPVSGGTARIRVIAYDANLNPIPNIPIIFTSSAGQLTSRGNIINTSSSGEASDMLQTSQTATVTATSGAKSANITITVQTNRTPTASFVVSPSNPKVTQEVFFDASASTDSDGSIGYYQWNFGDGDTASGVRVSHCYSQAGTYTVLLTVTDNQNSRASVQQSITVSAQAEETQK